MNTLTTQDFENSGYSRERAMKLAGDPATNWKAEGGGKRSTPHAPVGTLPPATESITLRVENGRWVAVYSSERVRRLMGCATLPTAFAGTVPAHEVARLVRERNPGVDVRVEGGAA